MLIFLVAINHYFKNLFFPSSTVCIRDELTWHNVFVILAPRGHSDILSDIGRIDVASEDSCVAPGNVHLIHLQVVCLVPLNED